MKKSTSEPRLSRKQALEQLIYTGRLMSNVCFNLGQRGGRTLGDADADRVKWDADLSAWRSLDKSTSKRKAKR